VHILAAVVWVGGATITQVYAARAMADPSPERLAGFARDAEFVGKTMFTPASLVLVVFGFLLVSEGNWSLGSTWLIFALAVFAASFAVGIGFLATRVGPDRPRHRAARRRLDRGHPAHRADLPGQPHRAAVPAAGGRGHGGQTGPVRTGEGQAEALLP
jgi:uncharacterized membrane protein